MNIKFLWWELPLYGVLFYAGIAAAAVVAMLISKKRNLSKFDLVSSGVYAMIGAFLGAKILFWAVSYKEIAEAFKQYPFEDVLFSIIKGGFVFYGGLIGGVLGLVIYVKQFKMSFGAFAEMFSVVIPLGHSIGRVGCFFAGCCYGIEYHGAFSHTYTEVAGNTPIGVPLLPVQLIEAACLLCLFAILLVAFLKKPKNPAFCPSVYAVGYAVIRFALEFFRGDRERGLLVGISTSQWISIVVVCFVVCLSLIKIKNRKNKPSL